MDHTKEILTWDAFADTSQQLAKAIRDDNFAPDAILGIARGGLFLAGSLAYELGVKSVFVINVEFYTGVDARLDTPVLLPPELKVSDLAGMNVLIVDDVADTGATLEVVQGLCRDAASDARSAVLYEKEVSTVRCRYVGRRTNDWIVFPWSQDDA